MLADVDRLAGLRARRHVERHVHRITTVELQPHLRDEPIARARDRLQHGDVIGRGLSLELDLPALAGDVRERADPPRSAGVAVDRVRRAVVGCVADRVAVRGRVDARHAALLDGGLRVVPSTGKDVEPVVGRVVDERRLTGLLGHADVLADGAPTSSLPAVRIGEHEVRVVVERTLHALGIVRERRRVEHRLLGSDDPGSGRVDDALATARHEHHTGGVLGSHDVAGLLDRERRDRRRVCRIGRCAQRDLVDEGELAIALFGTGSPNAFGVPRPGVASISAQRLRGRGVRYRSYCRSDRRLISPTPMSAATVASDEGSYHPSCSRRSSALSRSADGALP